MNKPTMGKKSTLAIAISSALLMTNSNSYGNNEEGETALRLVGDDGIVVSYCDECNSPQWNAYANSQYTYDDADLLADYWGKATPWDAKLKIGNLLMSGNNRTVNTLMTMLIS
jgi:hypothetical protein